MKPAIFVGSSVESKSIAYAVQEELSHDADVTVWTQGIFKLSGTTLDDLLIALDKSDFGVFIFSPEDLVTIQNQQFLSTRDNVVFEMGLFVGRLGKSRNFFILPEGHSDFRLPTDLVGITPGTYDSYRSDGNLQAALGPACNKIRMAVTSLGSLKRSSIVPDNAANQPEDWFYHFRVQRLITGTSTGPNDARFAYNVAKSYFSAVATRLSNGQHANVAGESFTGIDINSGMVALGVLRSKAKVDTASLAGANAQVKDQYWNDLQYGIDVVDITAELQISNTYSRE